MLWELLEERNQMQRLFFKWIWLKAAWMFQYSVWKHQGVSKWGHGLPPSPVVWEPGERRGWEGGLDELPHGVVLLRNRTFDSARAAPGLGRLSKESWHVRHSAWGLTNPGFGSVHSYIPRPMWTPRWWQDEKEQRRGLLRERRAEFQETPPGTKSFCLTSFIRMVGMPGSWNSRLF